MGDSGVTTAVFPLAGRATRLMPLTFASSKALLPVYDRPLLHWALQEALAAGMKRFVFVVSKGDDAVSRYLAPSPELETLLKARSGRYAQKALAALRVLESVRAGAVFVEQEQPLGLGDAVLRARPQVEESYMAVVLCDDLMDADPPALSALLAAHRSAAGSFLALETVPKALTPRYGIVAPAGGGYDKKTGALALGGFVEKPAVEEAPSALAVVGRYILNRAVFSHLEGVRSGAQGEVQLTDAMESLRAAGEPFYGVKLSGRRYDCGTIDGLLRANVAMAEKGR